MKALLTSVSLFFVALSLSVPCRGDVIYSNLGPGDSVAAGEIALGSAAALDLGVIAPQNPQQFFQSDGTFSVTSFTLAVSYFTAGPPDSPLFNADLYSDTETSLTLIGGTVLVSHIPDAEIGVIGQGIAAPNSPGLVTVNPLTSPLTLTSGSFYWVILTPDNPQTSVVWDDNAFQVDGTLLTPEPATLGLLTFSLAGLTAIRRKRLTR